MHTVVSIMQHEEWNADTFENDIAVWQVTPPFVWGTATAPIALLEQGTETPDFTLLTVSGWGATSTGGSESSDLLRVDVPVVPVSDCDTAYQAYGGVFPSQICAGFADGGADACTGDSGGPLFREGALHGISSWGNGCAQPGYPGIYTKASAFTDWIRLNTNKMLFKVVVVLACATLALAGTSRLQGAKLFKAGDKIVGGSPARAGEIPWQVSIQTNIGGFHMCGGSIISNDFIVTAAHCSENRPSYYQVVAGTLQSASPGTIHSVVEIITADWNSNTNENDISLWRVDPPFVFDTNTDAVQLPAQGTESTAGSRMTVSGWGTTSYGGSASPDLLKVDVPIVSKTECSSNYAAYGGIPPNQICAGEAAGGADSCQGDSGGPLFRNGELRGIVSWGNGCAWAGFPGVYTEVSAYRDWINLNTGV
ncbi:trypsin-1-like [Cloeon dipterum]|uniref:trypsin-1-like n=1 Tax=Cloeon dipterum TaxID=197152 RepID=UPI0032203226